MRHLLWGALTLLCGAAAPSTAPAGAAGTPEQLAFFDEHVKPILQTTCLKCHGGGEKIKGGLKLTSREAILLGGDTGPAVFLDHPDKSLLLELINYEADTKMPPKTKLPQEQIDALTQWVKMGAAWPAGLDLTPAGRTGAVASSVVPPKVDDAARRFWSFQPVQRPGVPAVRHAAWARNPIDHFILAKLEAKGIEPAPPADKAALLRRATYDLTGLPPSPADVQAFLADASPDAYEKVIDRLLASPQYGEKWGRHWLDLVRYGESNSYERDNAKPNAWRFRDYVIRSLNTDKPYDQFIREQLAGDEMPRGADDYDPIIATGYYRLGIWDDDPPDRAQAQYESLDDLVSTTGNVFLGLTIDCARCHDHKLDPIPQKDYYRLLAFFQNINPYRNGGPTDEMPIFAKASDQQGYEHRQREQAQRKQQVQADVTAIENDFRQLLAGQTDKPPPAPGQVRSLIAQNGAQVLGQSRYDAYRGLRNELDALSKPDVGQDRALRVTEGGPKAPDTFVLMRGNAAAPGAKVEPGFLQVIGTPDPVIPAPQAGASTSGRRTALADWIASKDNPLTARVMANRVWQYHFGRGIVRSPSNFGFQGDKPTHPELLDYLASELVADGWKLKPLHRLIMTSAAYRMASAGDPRTAAAARGADPQNDLLWRFDLRRLTAEEIRDSVLAVNGTLNLKMFGPSIYPHIPAEVLAGESRPGKGWGTSPPEETCRRSVYVHQKRSLRVPILEGLDAPESDRSCPVRFATVQPTQALQMLNGQFFGEEAERLAARLQREAGGDVRREVELALRLALCRTPSDREIARGVDLIAGLQDGDHAAPGVAMKYFCLMVYNLNEFVYVD